MPLEERFSVTLVGTGESLHNVAMGLVLVCAALLATSLGALRASAPPAQS